MEIKSGVNLNCGSVYPSLVQAVEQGLVTEELIVILKNDDVLPLKNDLSKYFESICENSKVPALRSEKGRA